MALEQQEIRQGVVRLQMQGAMTVYDAVALKEGLLLAVRNHQRTELDLSQVDDLDTAGIQLLMMIKQEARRLGHDLHIVAHSNIVVQLFEFLNLAGFFGDPLVIPATGN